MGRILGDAYEDTNMITPTLMAPICSHCFRHGDVDGVAIRPGKGACAWCGSVDELIVPAGGICGACDYWHLSESEREEYADDTEGLMMSDKDHAPDYAWTWEPGFCGECGQSLPMCDRTCA